MSTTCCLLYRTLVKSLSSPSFTKSSRVLCSCLQSPDLMPRWMTACNRFWYSAVVVKPDCNIHSLAVNNKVSFVNAYDTIIKYYCKASQFKTMHLFLPFFHYPSPFYAFSVKRYSYAIIYVPLQWPGNRLWHVVTSTLDITTTQILPASQCC